MNISYCDLCATPIKNGQSWFFYIASPENMSNSLESKKDINNYINKVQSEQKEICPTCKHLFDKIFYYRLEGMAELTEKCYEMFGLPPYDKKGKK